MIDFKLNPPPLFEGVSNKDGFDVFVEDQTPLATSSSGISVPFMLAAFGFDSDEGISTATDGGATAAVAAGGTVLTTSATGTSSARASMQLIGDIDEVEKGSPIATLWVSTSTRGTDFQAFFGLGQPGLSGTAYTFTAEHIGFKIIRAASGDINLYATQGDGVTENASGILVALATGARTQLGLCIRVNSTTSVDYYYRNGAGNAWSAATNLTSNMPTTMNMSIGGGVTNATVASNTVFTLRSASYQY